MECIEFHDKHGHFESLDGQGDKGDSFDDPSQPSEPDNDRNDDGDGPEHPDDDMLQRLADWYEEEQKQDQGKKLQIGRLEEWSQVISRVYQASRRLNNLVDDLLEGCNNYSFPVKWKFEYCEEEEKDVWTRIEPGPNVPKSGSRICRMVKKSLDPNRRTLVVSAEDFWKRMLHEEHDKPQQGLSIQEMLCQCLPPEEESNSPLQGHFQNTLMSIICSLQQHWEVQRNSTGLGTQSDGPCVVVIMPPHWTGTQKVKKNPSNGESAQVVHGSESDEEEETDKQYLEEDFVREEESDQQYLDRNVARVLAALPQGYEDYCKKCWQEGQTTHTVRVVFTVHQELQSRVGHWVSVAAQASAKVQGNHTTCNIECHYYDGLGIIGSERKDAGSAMMNKVMNVLDRVMVHLQAIAQGLGTEAQNREGGGWTTTKDIKFFDGASGMVIPQNAQEGDVSCGALAAFSAMVSCRYSFQEREKLGLGDLLPDQAGFNQGGRHPTDLIRWVILVLLRGHLYLSDEEKAFRDHKNVWEKELQEAIWIVLPPTGWEVDPFRLADVTQIVERVKARMSVNPSGKNIRECKDYLNKTMTGSDTDERWGDKAVEMACRKYCVAAAEFGATTEWEVTVTGITFPQTDDHFPLHPKGICSEVIPLIIKTLLLAFGTNPKHFPHWQDSPPSLIPVLPITLPEDKEGGFWKVLSLKIENSKSSCPEVYRKLEKLESDLQELYAQQKSKSEVQGQDQSFESWINAHAEVLANATGKLPRVETTGFCFQVQILRPPLMLPPSGDAMRFHDMMRESQSNGMQTCGVLSKGQRDELLELVQTKIIAHVEGGGLQLLDYCFPIISQLGEDCGNDLDNMGMLFFARVSSVLLGKKPWLTTPFLSVHMVPVIRLVVGSLQGEMAQWKDDLDNQQVDYLTYTQNLTSFKIGTCALGQFHKRLEESQTQHGSIDFTGIFLEAGSLIPEGTDSAQENSISAEQLLKQLLNASGITCLTKGGKPAEAGQTRDPTDGGHVAALVANWRQIIAGLTDEGRQSLQSHVKERRSLLDRAKENLGRLVDKASDLGQVDTALASNDAVTVKDDTPIKWLEFVEQKTGELGSPVHVVTDLFFGQRIMNSKWILDFHRVFSSGNIEALLNAIPHQETPSDWRLHSLVMKYDKHCQDENVLCTWQLVESEIGNEPLRILREMAALSAAVDTAVDTELRKVLIYVATKSGTCGRKELLGKAVARLQRRALQRAEPKFQPVEDRRKAQDGHLGLLGEMQRILSLLKSHSNEKDLTLHGLAEDCKKVLHQKDVYRITTPLASADSLFCGGDSQDARKAAAQKFPGLFALLQKVYVALEGSRALGELVNRFRIWAVALLDASQENASRSGWAMGKNQRLGMQPKKVVDALSRRLGFEERLAFMYIQESTDEPTSFYPDDMDVRKRLKALPTICIKKSQVQLNSLPPKVDLCFYSIQPQSP